MFKELIVSPQQKIAKESESVLGTGCLLDRKSELG
jgi:hypothetical protein